MSDDEERDEAAIDRSGVPRRWWALLAVGAVAAAVLIVLGSRGDEFAVGTTWDDVLAVPDHVGVGDLGTETVVPTHRISAGGTVWFECQKGLASSSPLQRERTYRGRLRLVRNNASPSGALSFTAEGSFESGDLVVPFSPHAPC